MISLSVALDPNKGIGLNNQLPWHIKEELQIFKANTLNKHIVMGRTTYEGLPGKLNNRIIMVLSRDLNYQNKDVELISDFEAFLKEHQNDETEYIVCGGSSIYKQAYPYVKKAYVSFIKKVYEVDCYFETFNLADFEIIKQEEHELFIYRQLRRKDL